MLSRGEGYARGTKATVGFNQNYVEKHQSDENNFFFLSFIFTFLISPTIREVEPIFDQCLHFMSPKTPENLLSPHIYGEISKISPISVNINQNMQLKKSYHFTQGH